MDHPADTIQKSRLNIPFGLRSARLQTVLASSKIRVPRHPVLLSQETEQIIETSEGIRLQGYLSSRHDTPGRAPLAILFHGWEGTVRSAYIQSTGNRLFETGFDVFRLHLRDHGDTHHLNEKPFRSDRIREVVDAVRHMAERYETTDIFLLGFSLGGNFALRVGLDVSRHPIDNLRHVLAVCPLMDPERSTRIIDAIPWLRHYFLKKWFRGLRKKEQAFPDIYDFSPIYQMSDCMAVTEWLIQRYSPYPDAVQYFKTYTISDDTFADLRVPTTILTADDDPVIPADDFRNLITNEHLRVVLAEHGGHCGFINSYRLNSAVNDIVPDLFRRAASSSI